MKASLLLRHSALLGEGALWHAPTQSLWWVDIDAHQAHRFCPQTNLNRTVNVGDTCGTIVPLPDGRALIALGRGIATLDFDTGHVLPHPSLSPDEPAGNRLNEGKCDPSGRFWVGGMALDGRPAASFLHRIDPDGRRIRVLDGVGCSNGIAWSADGTTLYYIDTLTRRVDAFDFDPEHGIPSRRRTLFGVPPELGYPDGMTLDAEGRLWIALWGGGRVICLDPQSRRIAAEIAVPASRVTSCAFGGPRLDQLFITTARPDPTASAEPEAGSLFIATPGVTGLPACAFAINLPNPQPIL